MQKKSFYASVERKFDMTPDFLRGVLFLYAATGLYYALMYCGNMISFHFPEDESIRSIAITSFVVKCLAQSVIAIALFFHIRRCAALTLAILAGLFLLGIIQFFLVQFSLPCSPDWKEAISKKFLRVIGLEMFFVLLAALFYAKSKRADAKRNELPTAQDAKLLGEGQ